MHDKCVPDPPMGTMDVFVMGTLTVPPLFFLCRVYICVPGPRSLPSLRDTTVRHTTPRNMGDISHDPAPSTPTTKKRPGGSLGGAPEGGLRRGSLLPPTPLPAYTADKWCLPRPGDCTVRQCRQHWRTVPLHTYTQLSLTEPLPCPCGNCV